MSELSNADKARSAALVDEDVREKVVEFKGARILVRKPTIADMRQAESWGTVKTARLSAKGEREAVLEVNEQLRNIAVVLMSAADADTRKPLFTKADFDRITTMRNPAIVKVIGEALGEISDVESPEEARGNSKGEEHSGCSTDSPPSPDV